MQANRLRTITLRLSAADADLIEACKCLTGHATASRAVLEAARRYRDQHQREAGLRAELDRRRERYDARAAELQESSRTLARLASLIREEARTWEGRA